MTKLSIGALTTKTPLVHEFNTRMGSGNPRVLWRFAGRSEAARGSQLRKYSKKWSNTVHNLLKNLFQIFPKPFQKWSRIFPRPYPNPVEILPKPMPNPSKIDPEGLLELILDQCFKSGTPKKQSKCSQKWRKDGQERPNPFPNRAQDLSKSIC